MFETNFSGHNKIWGALLTNNPATTGCVKYPSQSSKDVIACFVGEVT